MGSPQQTTHAFANYLPDEILLEILNHIPAGPKSQPTLASFCLVSRQWYNVGISKLYEAPNLVGKTYGLFVRTICPSLNTHIKKSELAGLVKVLDLSQIVHQGNKATTARLLNRTKASLEIFCAPVASFGINSLAALPKCTALRVLDLSLVSESLSFVELTSKLHRLPKLTDLYLPRCSSQYSSTPELKVALEWPPQLKHLQLSGSVHGKFMWDMLRQPAHIPRLNSAAFSHCPSIQGWEIHEFIASMADTLTRLELRHLPAVGESSLDGVLDWAPHLRELVIAVDYLSIAFGHMPDGFSADDWKESKPLESLTLVSSGRSMDPNRSLSIIDLYTLIDDRFFGRLRYLAIDSLIGWAKDEEEFESLESALELLDEENWERRRWHYEQFEGMYEGVSWDNWIQTSKGRQMRPRFRLLKDQRLQKS